MSTLELTENLEANVLKFGVLLNINLPVLMWIRGPSFQALILMFLFYDLGKQAFPSVSR